MLLWLPRCQSLKFLFLHTLNDNLGVPLWHLNVAMTPETLHCVFDLRLFNIYRLLIK